MNILITGCDGYIGEHLVEVLKLSKHKLHGFDLKKTKCAMEHLDTFHFGDICDILTLERCIIKVNPDIIIDLAANSSVSSNDTLFDHKANYCTPDNFADIVERNTNISLKKIIFTSTQYVIGPTINGCEKLGYAPHTIYGVSKVLLEQKIFTRDQSFSRSGIDYIIVRPTNVWGGKHPKYSGIWEKLLKKKLVIVPSKEVIKSYCHISTLCDLFSRSINAPINTLSKENRIVYGSDLPMSQTDWVHIQVEALRACGFKAGFFKAPLWLIYKVSLVLSVLSFLFRRSNPLPHSRVESMKGSYIVNLDCPKSLMCNKSYKELVPVVLKDVSQRYDVL